MGISIKTIQCPNCSAALPVEEGRDQFFCSYCGSKITVTNDNEHIYRNIDEAKIIQAETERMVKMHEMKISDKNSSLRKVLTIIWGCITVVLLVIAIVIMLSEGSEYMPGWVAGFLFLCYACAPIIGGGAYLVFKVLPDRESGSLLKSCGGIVFPRGLNPFDKQHYSGLESALKSAGFTNIRCVNLHDQMIEWPIRSGKVVEVTVDGKRILTGGRVYMPDVSIVITYHGK